MNRSVFLLLLLAACSRQPAQAEKAVASRLIDPSSAQFDSVVVRNEQLVCGKYNAKNAYGAYTGFEGFVYRDGLVTFQNDRNYSREYDICYPQSDCDRKKVQIMSEMVAKGTRSEDIPDSLMLDPC